MVPMALCSEAATVMSCTEDDDLWGSDYKGEETNSRAPKVNFPSFDSSSEDSDDNRRNDGKVGKMKKNTDESWDSD